MADLHHVGESDQVMLRLVVLVIFGIGALAGCGAGGVLSRAQLEQARMQGVAPDLIYVVTLEGYEMAEQSIGGHGEEGFGVFYVSPEGKQVQLTVDRGTFSDGLCADAPVAGAELPAATVTCDRDEVGWYRASGGWHEYVAARADRLIKLSGRVVDVDRAALKAAVAGARHATGDGSETAPPSGTPPTPVERGDLPTNGDGAPNNEVGVGG